MRRSITLISDFVRANREITYGKKTKLIKFVNVCVLVHCIRIYVSVPSGVSIYLFAAVYCSVESFAL